jgi:hypothetical protein
MESHATTRFQRAGRVFELRLEGQPGKDGIRALRKFLKAARRLGWWCVGVRHVRQETK